MGYRNSPTGGTSKDISPLIALLGAAMGVPTGIEGGALIPPDSGPTADVPGSNPLTRMPKVTPYKAKSPKFDMLMGGAATRQADAGNMQSGGAILDAVLRQQQSGLTDEFTRKQMELENQLRLGQIREEGTSRKDVATHGFGLDTQLEAIRNANKLGQGDAGVANANGLMSNRVGALDQVTAQNLLRTLSANTAAGAGRAESQVMQDSITQRMLDENKAPGVANLNKSIVTQRVGEQNFVPKSFFDLGYSVLPGQVENQITTEEGGMTLPNGITLPGKPVTRTVTENRPGYNVASPEDHAARLEALVVKGKELSGGARTPNAPSAAKSTAEQILGPLRAEIEASYQGTPIKQPQATGSTIKELPSATPFMKRGSAADSIRNLPFMRSLSGLPTLGGEAPEYIPPSDRYSPMTLETFQQIQRMIDENLKANPLPAKKKERATFVK